MPCPCFLIVEPVEDKRQALAVLERVRGECPAIREVLVPDGIWDKYRAFTLKSDEALHHPLVVGAIMDGMLPAITGPIHKFHLESERKFRPGFLGSIAETWWQAPTLVASEDRRGRHERKRIFQSHVVELLVADELDRAGRQILDLAAWSDGVDVLALGDADTPMRIEVKYLGMENDQFLEICESIAGRASGGSFSPHVAKNYLIIRAYEAALQLQRHGGDGAGVVCIVVEELGWHKFDTGRVIWPGFLEDLRLEEVNDPDWLEFMDGLAAKYPGFPDNVDEVIATVDAIWIMKRVGVSTLVLEEQRERRAVPSAILGQPTVALWPPIDVTPSVIFSPRN